MRVLNGPPMDFIDVRLTERGSQSRWNPEMGRQCLAKAKSSLCSSGMNADCRILSSPNSEQRIVKEYVNERWGRQSPHTIFSEGK